MWHLSLANFLSCWPSLVDRTVREHSDDPLVVIIVIVEMRVTAGSF